MEEVALELEMVEDMAAAEEEEDAGWDSRAKDSAGVAALGEADRQEREGAKVREKAAVVVKEVVAAVEAVDLAGASKTKSREASIAALLSVCALVPHSSSQSGAAHDCRFAPL